MPATYILAATSVPPALLSPSPSSRCLVTAAFAWPPVLPRSCPLPLLCASPHFSLCHPVKKETVPVFNTIAGNTFM